jgi:hypothetical protein
LSSYLVSKLHSYLVRLQLTYQNTGERLLADLIGSSRYVAIEHTAYDNWNGGMDGHDVLFCLPVETVSKIPLDDIADVASRIKDDLNKLAQGVENEWFNLVRLEMDDPNDPDYQKAVPFSKSLPVNPDTLSFWKPGLARLFISHRDQHKADARQLSDALEEFGISCFVAHDTIQPLTEWRTEIMKGLETMEVMLVYLTDDFEESLWCHQEVGFALGKGVPIISLKLGRKDPPGFISHVQAMRGQADKPLASARSLFPLIGKALGRQERLQEVLITSFVDSPSWIHTKARFDRMAESVTALTDTQLKQIIDGFYASSQLFQSGYLTSNYNRLRHFLERTTGKVFQLEGRTITEVKPNVQSGIDDLSDDVPF